MSDYRINPVAVEGTADADGVHENEAGAWLGEVDYRTDEDGNNDRYVAVYSDEDGGFVPAPANWRELVIEKL